MPITLPIISLSNVTKKFGDKVVLSNVNMSVYPKEIFGIIGVSGAGKTTLLRALIGFYDLDFGSIYINNRDVSKSIAVVKKDVGFCTQDGCFYERLTVMENLVYFGKMYGLPRKVIEQRAKMLLDMVHLSGDMDTLAKDLSGGMKRRLDITCALIHQPQLLILDEPTVGLDPLLRSQMWKLIHEINKRGTTIIISSHLLGEIEKMGTRVGILSDGTIIDVGTPDQLRAKYSHSEEVVLETIPGNYDDLVNRLRKKGGLIASVTHREHNLVIYTPHAEAVLRETLDWVDESKERLIEVDVNKPSLAEVFETLMRWREGTKYEEINHLKFSVHHAHRSGFTKEQIRHMLLK